MTGRGLTRRDLLARGVRGAAGLGLGAWCFACDAPPRGTALEVLLTTLDSGHEFGEGYLVSHPADRDVAQLEARLLADYAGDVTRATRAELERFFAEQIRADFEAGRVVVVERWVLARTEARLFARAALRARTTRGAHEPR